MADTAQRRPGLRPAPGAGRPLPALPPRARAAAFVRRHKLAPYLLLAPALAGIALVLLWPLAQVVLFSFQNYGLPQLTGAQPTQWVGLANFTATFTDPEFWLSLRNTVAFAVVVVPLTLLLGTAIGLLLNRLGRKMAAFVSGAALLAPALAGIALVLLWPLAQVVLFSFQNYGLPQLTGAQPTQWVGLANFTSTFADPEFWLSLRNTVAFAVVVVPLTLLLGMAIGLLLNRLGRKMAGFVSAAALLAWATPPTAGAVLFYWLFNPDGGLVDWGLAKLPHWLVGSTNWAQYNWTTTGALQAYTVLTILVLWTSFPFIAVSVLAGLKTVPGELYEAARIDGAGSWGTFRRITYPLLKPIFLVLLLLSVIWDFNVFNQIYLISGFPGNQNEYNLSLYSYDKAFGFPPSYGLGGALALIFTFILLVITVGYVRASVRQGVIA